MEYRGKIGERIAIQNWSASDDWRMEELGQGELSLLWVLEDNTRLKIDSIDYTFEKNDAIFLTEFNVVKVLSLSKVKRLIWNKSFYCVLDHDGEVGCRGLLFYGASELPIIRLADDAEQMLNTAWRMLEQEMTMVDNLQQDMLQMLLTRILILCTRFYKVQHDFQGVQKENADIIRNYNFLVEQHFKEKHTVSEYAELLHKSPKTLSNIFKKIGNKSPLEFIHDRKFLEAKRLLSYSDMTISEIGYELGYADIQSFSRFFKKMAGVPPQVFRASNGA